MRIGADPSPTSESTNVSTIGKVRVGMTSREPGMDTYELREGVLITREEVTFPSGEETNKVMNSGPDKVEFLV